MLPIFDLPPIDFKYTLEVRERIERRLDRDFLQSNPDNRSDAYTRVRPGFELTYGEHFSAAVQYQYAHDWVSTPAKTFTRDNSDATLAYLRYTAPNKSVTVGRFKFSAGSERLIGPLEWNNVSRSYDGLNIVGPNWQVFATRIGVSLPKPREAELYGAECTNRYGKSFVAFKKDATSAGDLEILTLDHTRKAGRGMFDWDYDLAYQTGFVGKLDHEAWAFHAGVGYKPAPRDRVYLEFNTASGGSGTSKSKTFDNLYPTNHKFYGSMDLMGWRNMRQLSAGWQRKLNAKADLHVHGHWNELADAKDGWYNALGALNKRSGGVFRDPTGKSGRDLGFELDVEGGFRLDTATQINLGMGLFEPGKFVERMNGGKADRQVWGFLMVNRKY